MNIGISTASLYPLETEKSLAYMVTNGIPVTEIFINSFSELEKGFIGELVKIKMSGETKVSSLHSCGSVAEPYFLFSDYKRRFYDAFEIYKRYYEAAERLGASILVIHGDSKKGHIEPKEYFYRLALLNEEAAKYGVTVAHENVNNFRCAEPDFVRLMNKEYPDVRYTYDVKQCVRAGVDPFLMYETMGKRIINVHISDHDEVSECMLPGRGDFDFSKLFEKLERDNFSGNCVIEVYKNAYKSIDEVKNSYNFVNNIHKTH